MSVSTTTSTDNNNNNNNNQHHHHHDAIAVLSSSSFYYYFWMLLVPLYLSIRIGMANQMPISDCDEVYNYWEPLHYLLYGTGLQTWEYAHEYALRTYAYLTPLQYIAMYIYQPLIASNSSNSHYHHYDWTTYLTVNGLPTGNDKVTLFALLRCTVAASTAVAELMWIHALLMKYSKYQQQQQHQQHMIVVVFTTALLLLAATGMNHAAGAFLPSTTWMTTWCICASCFLRQKHTFFAITAIAATLTTGWPFGAVCVVPMALCILYKEYTTKGKLIWYVISLIGWTILIQGWVFSIDAHYYGIDWVSPTWNIFKYNAAGGGDELYGVEPFSFYIKNLVLNLNVLFPLGTLTLPIFAIQKVFGTSTNKEKEDKKNSSSTTTTKTHNTMMNVDMDLFAMLLSIPFWYIITFPRPHKEERFMFPIYPILTFSAVLSLHWINDFLRTHQILPMLTSRRHIYFFPGLVVLTSLFLSSSRTMALHKYYTAPLAAYNALAAQTLHVPNPHNVNTNTNATTANLVCTCGEWYRYPSSFYLPPKTQLGFLPSSFTGQLPQPFSEYGSLPTSQAVLQPFNDRNQHEPDRYVSGSSGSGGSNKTKTKTKPADSCAYYVVLNTEEPANGPCGWMPLYGLSRVAVEDFLVQAPTLHRILYLPGYHERAVQTQIDTEGNTKIQYDQYVIYQTYPGNVKRLK